MEKREFIKIDNIFVCEIKEARQLEYVQEEYTILNILKEESDSEIVLLFHIEGGAGLNKIIKYTLNELEKELIKEKEINNFLIFDFLFFTNILEDDSNNFEMDDKEGLEKTYSFFEEKLFAYRRGVVLNKSFNVKQRRISRKQLEKMELNFKKWEEESIF